MSRSDGKRNRCGKGNPNHNYLPSTLTSAFQEELINLVDGLDQGAKSDYLKAEFLSKYCDKGTTPPDVRVDRAIAKWLGTEARNAYTNQRILLMDESDDFGWAKAPDIVSKAKSIITDILGPVEKFFSEESYFSNGASTRIRRGPTAAIQKHGGQAHVTEDALPYWRHHTHQSLIDYSEVEIVQSSVLFTVPKTAEIDRVACKEPEVNMFLQRKAGLLIRKRLRKVGIDLRDQSVNQELARVAKDRGLATIDLSSASDSISSMLVRSLLPFDWWSLLEDLRVRSVRLPDGSIHILEMFSSMGNGFTFELESLIFYALTRAVCWFSGIKGRISVYGDDIICSSKVARRLARVFFFFGFLVNSKKSNWTGPLRESCGVHYHNGFDVTPFYLRAPICCKRDIIRFLNHLLAWDGRQLRQFTTEELYLFHSKWRRVIPQSLWGGQDVSDDTCLVTGHRPRKRLIPTTKPEPFDHSLGLLNWYTVKEFAGEIPVESDPQLARGRHRIESANCKEWQLHNTWHPYIMYE